MRTFHLCHPSATLPPPPTTPPPLPPHTHTPPAIVEIYYIAQRSEGREKRKHAIITHNIQYRQYTKNEINNCGDNDKTLWRTPHSVYITHTSHVVIGRKFQFASESGRKPFYTQVIMRYLRVKWFNLKWWCSSVKVFWQLTWRACDCE